MNLLDQIVATKRQEIADLRLRNDLSELRKSVRPAAVDFAGSVAEVRRNKLRYLIAEFKRRSPSAGAIAGDASVQEQVGFYRISGAHAVSVLTDTPYFGGSYADLAQAAQVLEGSGILLLQKDFVLDEIQIWLARQAGAQLILLIAAILSPAELASLSAVAYQLGMGVLYEVKSREDIAKIAPQQPPVVGINHRDLTRFRIALGRSAALRQHVSPGTLVIAESGITSGIDLAFTPHADGYLVGTGLMRQPELMAQLTAHHTPRYLLKACGIRSPEHIRADTADLIGLNFSHLSRRRITPEVLDPAQLPPNAVAVFYGNPLSEIMATLRKHPFPYVQLYAPEVPPEALLDIPGRVLLALKASTPKLLDTATQYAEHVDAFILDSPEPGSGKLADIPSGFPYPFLLAGGITADTAERILAHPTCVGVDSASGIEADGRVSLARIHALRQRLDALATAPKPAPAS